MPRRRSEPIQVGALVPRVLGELGLGPAAAVARLAQRWEVVVGPEVAAHCRPVALRGRSLEAATDSSVWCQQLRLRAPAILRAVREELGAEAPDEIWFRVGELPSSRGGGVR